MARRTTEQMIMQALSEGFKLEATFPGKYDMELIQNYRNDGFDVRYWYVKDGNWALYIKEKSQKIADVAQVIETPVEEKPDFMSMTVKKLQELCKSMGITGYSKMNKSQLIACLA